MRSARAFASAIALLGAWGCATPRQAAAPSGRAPAPPPARAVASSKAPEPALAPVVGKVRFAVTGDIMAHGAVKDAASAMGGFDPLYAEVRPIIAAADVAFGNLETPVAPKADKGSRPFVFNAPPAMLLALKRAGFDVLLVANNHIYDQDRAGLAETLDELDAAGLREVGAGRTRAQAEAPLRLEVNGVKLAWFGATELFNDPKNVDDPSQPRANLLDPGALARSIAAVRPEVDAVLVSVHWGVEYMDAPRQQEIDLAHELFDAGADVIIGSHPHVLQPLEIYRAADGRMCLCFYSLGNFISNQSRTYLAHASADKVGDTRDGAIARFTLEKRSYGGAGTAVDLADVSYVPLWTVNAHYRANGAPLDIHPEVIDAALARLKAAIAKAESAAGKSPAHDHALIALKQEVDLLELRRARIVARLGEDFAGDP